jgi:hypothetical protein
MRRGVTLALQVLRVAGDKEASRMWITRDVEMIDSHEYPNNYSWLMQCQANAGIGDNHWLSRREALTRIRGTIAIHSLEVAWANHRFNSYSRRYASQAPLKGSQPSCCLFNLFFVFHFSMNFFD